MKIKNRGRFIDRQRKKKNKQTNKRSADKLVEISLSKSELHHKKNWWNNELLLKFYPFFYFTAIDIDMTSACA